MSAHNRHGGRRPAARAFAHAPADPAPEALRQAWEVGELRIVEGKEPPVRGPLTSALLRRLWATGICRAVSGKGAPHVR